MTPRPRPVADTNVVVSGLYGSGAPAVLLNLHNGGRLTVVVSRQVLGGASDEMRRKRPSLLADLEAFLGDTPPELAAEPTPEDVRAVACRIDRTDAPILAAATKSGADCLVGGNTRLDTQPAAVGRQRSDPVPAPYAATPVP